MRYLFACLFIVLAGCATHAPSFQGNWMVPGDGSRRLIIQAHEGSFINSAAGRVVKLHYVLRSPTEAAFMNEKGVVSIVCDLSDDGESLQMFVQKQFGGGMYTFQRMP